MFGNPETTPGGLAMKFYASVRIDARKIETLKDGNEIVGSRHRIRIVKNKVAAPFRVAEIDILSKTGISKMGSLLDVGVEMGVINRAGAFYKHGDEMLGQGRYATVDFLTENQKTANQIAKQIWQAVNKQKEDVPKEFGEDKQE
jgi:recombination protein RecA